MEGTAGEVDGVVEGWVLLVFEIDVESAKRVFGGEVDVMRDSTEMRVGDDMVPKRVGG